MWWSFFEIWITKGLAMKMNRCYHASHILEMLLNFGISVSTIKHHFEMYIEYHIQIIEVTSRYNQNTVYLEIKV